MELVGNVYRKCISINSVPQVCSGAGILGDDNPWRNQDVASQDGPLQLQPDETLEALEIETELLVAPIEFTAQRESPSQLQQRFYKRKAELEKIKGPSSSEKDRTTQLARTMEKEVTVAAMPVYVAKEKSAHT